MPTNQLAGQWAPAYVAAGDRPVAIVTGAASGIGWATCSRLAEAGVLVAAVDRDDEALRASWAKTDYVGDVFPLAADVSIERQVADVVERVIARWGAVDLLHNHAGVLSSADSSIDTLDESVIDATLSVNVKGQMLVGKHVAKVMKVQRSGSIVCTASDVAFAALPNVCAYITSKAAVLGLSRAMAVDLAPFGIRVNAVCPGFINTKMTAAIREDPFVYERLTKDYLTPRVGEPDDVAHLVCYLLSSQAGFMTGGQYLIDGGRTAW